MWEYFPYIVISIHGHFAYLEGGGGGGIKCRNDKGAVAWIIHGEDPTGGSEELTEIKEEY